MLCLFKHFVKLSTLKKKLILFNYTFMKHFISKIKPLREQTLKENIYFKIKIYVGAIILLHFIVNLFVQLVKYKKTILLNCLQQKIQLRDPLTTPVPAPKKKN